jgi:hypothetical protein
MKIDADIIVSVVSVIIGAGGLIGAFWQSKKAKQQRKN